MLLHSLKDIFVNTGYLVLQKSTQTHTRELQSPPFQPSCTCFLAKHWELTCIYRCVRIIIAKYIRFLVNIVDSHLLSYAEAPSSQPKRRAMQSYPCSSCSGEFLAPSEALLLRHIRIAHSSDPDFSIQCSFGGCLRTFRNFRTYQNHLLKHSGRHNSSDEAVPPDLSSGDDADTGDILANSAVTTMHNPTSTDMQSFEHNGY